MFVCVVWYLILHVFLFFFFKQKTAYEMRISDWSSDVCSSDLACAPKVAAPTRAANRARDSILFLLIVFDSCSGHRTRGREAISVRRAPAGCLGGRRCKEKMGPQARSISAESGMVCSRSEESRVGKECVHTCRFRWSPYN